jgi:hypothetical protein
MVEWFIAEELSLACCGDSRRRSWVPLLGRCASGVLSVSCEPDTLGPTKLSSKVL